MTELELMAAQRDEAAHAPGSLRLWADEMTAAAHIARGIAGTPFVPGALRVFTRGEPDLSATTANIAAALLAGRELGLEPMAALRSIHVIDGTPGLSALAMRALVVAAGHEMWLEQSSATVAVVQGRRRGSNRVQESRWTMDRAERLGLPARKGENWRRQPIAMLIARATSECARLVAPEALLGLPYSAEELADGAVDDVALGTAIRPPQNGRRAPATRTAQRRRITAHTDPAPSSADAAAPSSSGGDEQTDRPGAVASGARSVADDPVLDDPARLSSRQLRAIQAAMRDLGIDKRTDRLELMSDAVGAVVRSTAELTPDQAAAVLAELDERKAARVRDQLEQHVEQQRREGAEAANALLAVTESQLDDDEEWPDAGLPFADEPEL